MLPDLSFGIRWNLMLENWSGHLLERWLELHRYPQYLAWLHKYLLPTLCWFMGPSFQNHNDYASLYFINENIFLHEDYSII